ncbi:uncharacterized protein F5891DRAFT_982724 [Suillus fuscotomentosus]|uniref:Uncharacterized protein n=1 Tax=Suillus fuscotomentosus TaxID=1912939 RepID=A0AAD4E073_9AGAM|nr:uncharacterized protein F5891DRAFT_982724 [Suillus fuscotomentosus]KAG1897336.1 hypothetical protein F5891DRAFT_982724 [Suillus fuscotomentosus]
MLDFTSQKRLKQCILVATNITLSFQLPPVQIPIGTESKTRPTMQAIEQHKLQVKTHLGVGEQFKHETEFELHQVKEQLRNAEENIAYLSDRVMTYRYRWLEEYYRADNLERHMPNGIHVPDLGQIPLGAPSPGFSTEFLAWDDM